MKCTWYVVCRAEATQGGELPTRAKGRRFWPVCDLHANKLEKLGLTPISVAEIDMTLRREAREAKK